MVPCSDLPLRARRASRRVAAVSLLLCCLAPPSLVPNWGPHIGSELASILYAPSSCPPSLALARLPGPVGRLTLLAVWQARSERTDIATLLIPAITAADAGFYLCVATSPAGTAQARIQVVVLPGAGPWG